MVKSQTDFGDIFLRGDLGDVVLVVLLSACSTNHHYRK